MLLNKCKWNDSLLQFSWRIDVKTKSRHQEKLNEPTAIIEFNIGQHEIPVHLIFLHFPIFYLNS